MNTQKDGFEARQLALFLLNTVTTQKKMLSEVWREMDQNRHDPSTRAEAQRLVLTILRHYFAIDAVLSTYVPNEPIKAIKNILRLMVAELRLAGTPAHAAVGLSVELAKSNPRTQKYAGLVNAVGRRIADESPVLPHNAKTVDWLEAKLIEAYGQPHFEAMLRSFEQAPPVDLSLKTPQDAEKWAQTLGGIDLGGGTIRLANKPQISKLEGYSTGEWWVQDFAAAQAVNLLGAVKGRQVLDLCAAPGGKTMQLAARGADVTALDVSGNRLKRLRENLARTKLEARIIEADLTTWEPDQKFDIILLDAPCTATGTIRRHPDLPFVKSRKEIGPLATQQYAFMRRALNWLAPNGVFMFVTCSLLPDEGERIFRRIPEGFHVHTPESATIRPEWATPEGFIRLCPDYLSKQGGMDGFFIATLKPNP